MRNATHSDAAVSSEEGNGGLLTIVADSDSDDVTSCMRSGISLARIQSSSSVRSRARISEGSKT